MNRAILLSGGKGLRAGGDIPKQYIDMGGEMMVIRALHALTSHPQIDSVRIVAEEEWRDRILDAAGESSKAKIEGFSAPGKNRALSILNALNDMKNVSDEDNVLIHDAARPFVSAELISGCLSGLKDHEGVMPGIPVKDTTYVCEDGRIKALLDRSSLRAGQAPEAFKLERFKKALEELLPDKILEINGSAEIAVLDGMDVAVIPGDEKNVKITTAEDVKKLSSYG